MQTLPILVYLQRLWINYLSCQVALIQLKEGSGIWSPALEKQAKKLIHHLKKLPPHVLATALQKEQDKLFQECIDFLCLFKPAFTPHHRETIPVAWQEGSTTLSAHHALTPSTPPLLIVPSLINRSHILDIDTQHSFIRYLVAQGMSPLLINWQNPLPQEHHFSLDNYIQRIISCVDYVYNTTGTPVILMGYCMGGLLALAAAQLLPSHKIKGLALLATPWHFHSPQFTRPLFKEEDIPSLTHLLSSYPLVPSWLIQALFYYLYPHLIQKKFQRFATLKDNTTGMGLFTAIEQWANDGIDMTIPVATQCLIDWLHYNTPYQGTWKVAGIPIMPQSLTCKSFIALPKKDHIVPLQSSLPLAHLLPHATLCPLPTGHIGMVTALDFQSLWQDSLINWMKHL